MGNAPQHLGQRRGLQPSPFPTHCCTYFSPLSCISYIFLLFAMVPLILSSSLFPPPPLFLSPALLSSFPHTPSLSFLLPSSFPLPSSPHSINLYSPPSLGSSPIPGPKPHPLFSIKWEDQSGSPDLLCLAVGVGLGLHRRAALNDKR